MIIREVQERTDALIGKLFQIWERSVKATHLFLSAQEIKQIAQYVPSALAEIPHLIMAVNEADEPVAFMGIEGKTLQMLFLAPNERGKGLGKQLVSYAIRHYSIQELGVNEQNPQAKGFYEHMGFRVNKRTDTDEQGNPYPILYMRREQQCDESPQL